MGEVVNLNKDNQFIDSDENLVKITESLLLESKEKIVQDDVLSIPISELVLFGPGIAAMLPIFNTVTQSICIPTDSLLRVANANVGDVLQIAKNGNFWGALKTADGKSRMAQFQSIGDYTVTSTIGAINPMMIIIAVSLYSIEKDMRSIIDLSKQILSFLENEKQSQIEGDLQELLDIIQNYKTNWDNEHFISGHYHMILDIQRTARKNIIFYQKQLEEQLTKKKILSYQNLINDTLRKFEDHFRYYRLSVYTFSMASLLEIVLSGNFKESYLNDVRKNIELFSKDYRLLFRKCSIFLEKISRTSIESNIIKGIGTTSKMMGKLINNIPVVKESPVDEMLQDAGLKLTKGGVSLETKAVKQFSKFSNPNTSIWIQKIEELIQIYNHSNEIYFDQENIYLFSSNS